MYYLAIASGALAILFSFFGAIIPSLNHVKKYHKLKSLSHLEELKTSNRIRITAIITGITQIIFYISMYLILKYNHPEILALFIVSSIGLIGCGVVKYKENKFIHNLFSYTYFVVSVIAVFLLGIVILKSNYLIFSVFNIISPIVVALVSLVSVLKKGKKTLFEEFLHTTFSYFWILVFIVSVVLK